MIENLRIIRFILIALLVILSWRVVNSVMMTEASLNPLELALQSAGENRKELEKVLCYYQKNPADSLKYKAACFLIENMPSYTYLTGKQLDNYKSYYNWLKRSPEKSPEQIVDSVLKTFGPMGELERKQDIKEVDSAYLCHNIEWAFKVWKGQPWGKKCII